MGLKENYERHKSAEKSKKDQEKALKGFGRKTLRHPDRIIRYAWWLGAFTLCLVIVGLFQVWAFIQSERAAIVLESVNMTAAKEADSVLIMLEFANGEKVPLS
jgi:hypothetical protein